MLQKKKGFTLIEILVVMLIATLMLGVVGGTMVFVTTTTDQLINQSEEIDMAKNIEKYLRAQYIANIESTVELDSVSGNLISNSEIIFSDTGLTNFEIKETDDGIFVKCYMTFESGRHFNFIIGVR